MNIMKRVLLLTAPLVFGVAAMGHANASLVSRDLFTAGDGLITYDGDTGLSWLDLTATVGQSYNGVAGGFGGFTTALGFRYATEVEVGRLFSNAGVVQGNIWGYWNFSNPYYLASVTLVSLLGVTYPFDGLTTGTYGLTGSTAQGSQGSHVFAWNGYNNHADSLAFQNAGSLDDSGNVYYVGSFLVSDITPVPEPANVLLFGSGIAVIGAATRLRRKKLEGRAA